MVMFVLYASSQAAPSAPTQKENRTLNVPNVRIVFDMRSTGTKQGIRFDSLDTQNQVGSPWIQHDSQKFSRYIPRRQRQPSNLYQ